MTPPISPELENMAKAAHDFRVARLNIGREQFVPWGELSEAMRADQIADMRAGLETLLDPGEGVVRAARVADEKRRYTQISNDQIMGECLTAAIRHILGEP